eukprot:scaffold131428_cov20-Tisochrysis_lutea.AAC.2
MRARDAHTRTHAWTHICTHAYAPAPAAGSGAAGLVGPCAVGMAFAGWAQGAPEPQLGTLCLERRKRKNHTGRWLIKPANVKENHNGNDNHKGINPKVDPIGGSAGAARRKGAPLGYAIPMCIFQ